VTSLAKNQGMAMRFKNLARLTERERIAICVRAKGQERISSFPLGLAFKDGSNRPVPMSATV